MTATQMIEATKRIAEPVAEAATAAPNDRVIAALERTTGAPRRILVFEGDNLVGIVTPTDVMHVIQRAPLRRTEPKRNAA